MELGKKLSERARDYREIREPIVVFGKHSKEGSSPGVFCCPNGLAIIPETNSIYICEGYNNRAQVYNKSFELYSNSVVRWEHQLVFVSNRTRYM